MRLGRLSLRQLHLAGSVVAVGLLLVVLTRPIPTSSPQSGEDPASQLHRWAAAGSGLDIGRRAPGLAAATSDDLQLTDLDGRPVSLAAYAGRPLWIVFWATWCPACKREMPDLIAAYRRHAADGLVVLAINAQESADVVRQHVSDNRIPYAVALDPTSAAKDTYAVLGLPTHYFIDRDGVVRDRAFGRLTPGDMEERLQRILGAGRGARSPRVGGPARHDSPNAGRTG
ncbi:MAG: TlpA family protein disulfide reductase [Dehalococcoidia bacterium]